MSDPLENQNTPITLGILEDDMRMREYLEMVLGDDESTKVLFSEGTIADAIAAHKKIAAPQVCLVDIQLPDGLGTEFVKHIKAASDTKALILTILGDKVSVMAALDAGADGYLLKDSSPQLIIDSIKDVAAGTNPMSAQASAHLLNALKDNREISNERTPSPLTAREIDVLTIFSKGMSYKETADILEISPHTVRIHAKAIYAKIKVASRGEAVFEAVKSGWIKF